MSHVWNTLTNLNTCPLKCILYHNARSKNNQLNNICRQSTLSWCVFLQLNQDQCFRRDQYRIKPRPEAHMDMTLLKCILKSFEEHRLDSTTTYNYNDTIYIIDNVIVLSDLVESSWYSSKRIIPYYAPLDKVLRYFACWKLNVFK